MTGVITLLMCFTVLDSLLFGRPQDIGLLVIPPAALFAFTQLRATLPGAPAAFGTVPPTNCNNYHLTFLENLRCYHWQVFSRFRESRDAKARVGIDIRYCWYTTLRHAHGRSGESQTQCLVIPNAHYFIFRVCRLH